MCDAQIPRELPPRHVRDISCLSSKPRSKDCHLWELTRTIYLRSLMSYLINMPITLSSRVHSNVFNMSSIKHTHLILLTNSLRSPPSTHFSSPPPPTPNPPPEPPPLTPQPSPTSPTTRAGRPPTTDPDAMTIFAGITVLGRILTFSLMIAN